MTLVNPVTPRTTTTAESPLSPETGKPFKATDRLDAGPGDRLHFWRLPDVSTGSVATVCIHQGPILAVSLESSTSDYSTITVLCTETGLVFWVFAIHAATQCLVTLHARIGHKGLSIPSEACSADWPSFWDTLRSTYVVIADVTQDDITFRNGALFLVSYRWAEHRRDPNSRVDAIHIARLASVLAKKLFRFHLKRLEPKSAKLTLNTPTHRSSLAYNFLRRTGMSHGVWENALLHEPFFVGLALRILHDCRATEACVEVIHTLSHSSVAPAESSDVGRSAAETEHWQTYASALQGAVEARQPLRDVIRSHTHLSREAVRYLDTLGLQECGIDALRLIERYIVNLLPVEFRPQSWRVVRSILPILRHLEEVEQDHFDLAALGAISGADLSFLRDQFRQSWRDYARSVVHQDGWRTYMARTKSHDIKVARRDRVSKAMPPVAAARRYLPRQVFRRVLYGLSTLSFRGRLSFQQHCDKSLVFPDESFSAAEVLAPHAAAAYVRHQPPAGAFVLVPVDATKLDMLMRASGWRIEFLQTPADLDAVAEAFENCLRTSVGYAVDWLKLKEALVRLKSPEGQESLLEIDIASQPPKIIQHLGPRNIKQDDRGIAIGKTVLGLVIDFLDGDRGKSWRAERSRHLRHIYDLNKEIAEDIRVREMERIFADWKLIDLAAARSSACGRS